MALDLSPYVSVIYVNSVGGSDASGNGSATNPYATIQKAVSTVTRDNTAIYLNKGEYTVTNMASMIHTSYSVTYLAETLDNSESKVVVKLQNSFNGGTISMNKLNVFNGIVFYITGQNQWFYVGNSSNINLTFNNCVFDGTAIHIPVTTGGNSTGATVTRLDYNYCSFIIPLQQFFGQSKQQAGVPYRCASVDSILLKNYSNDNQLNAKFIENYKLNDKSLEFGVYHGSYAWRMIANKILLLSGSKTYSLISKKHGTKMTSNNTPSPFVVSASSSYNTTTNAPFRAFDGDSSVNWITANGQTTGWVQIDYGKIIELNAVQVNTKGSALHETAFPKRFQILGSNDGVSFDTIKEYEYLKWKERDNHLFSFGKLLKYRYLRFNILINSGHASYVGVPELLFMVANVVHELPNTSEQNFIKYGMDSPVDTAPILMNKNYIFSKTESVNADGLLEGKINRKPLSIKFN